VDKTKVTILSGEKYKFFEYFTQNKWAKINRLSRNGLSEVAKMCAYTGKLSYDCRNGFFMKNKFCSNVVKTCKLVTWI